MTLLNVHVKTFLQPDIYFVKVCKAFTEFRLSNVMISNTKSFILEFV